MATRGKNNPIVRLCAPVNRAHGRIAVTVLVGVVSALAAVPALAGTISPGVDLFSTPPGTFDDISTPAGFFGPGSDPVDGRVSFEGNPTSLIPGCGQVDTIVRRLQGATLSLPGQQAIVSTEMIALDLVSTSPITITFTGGGSSEYEVRVCLSSLHSQENGSMTITLDCASGGTFDSTTPVTAKLKCTRVSGTQGSSSEEIDDGTSLNFTADGCWSHYPGLSPCTTGPGTVDHDCDGAADRVHPGSSNNFYAAVCGCAGQTADLISEEELLAKHKIRPGKEHDPEPNPDVQACCKDNGDCIDVEPADCPGTPMGSGTDCDTTDCPQEATGACCDDDTGVCNDGVSASACQAPLRFAADTLCPDLDPPCGEQQDDEPCEDCGPGAHWVDTCTAGPDQMPSAAGTMPTTTPRCGSVR